jgi:carbonic anhydrase
MTGGDHGHLLVHCNFGNLLNDYDTSWLAVLQLALMDFEIQDIVICGHYGCVAANVFANEPLGLIDRWIDPLIELTEMHQPELAGIGNETARFARFCEPNVVHQVRTLTSSATLRRILVDDQSCAVYGLMFQPWDYRLVELDVSAQAPTEVNRQWRH